MWVAQQSLGNRDEAGAAATDYLRMFALVALGYMWARSAQGAANHKGNKNDHFYQAKLATANFYMTRLLPHTSGLLAAITAGAKPIMGFREEWF
jgi:hypothetical protein